MKRGFSYPIHLLVQGFLPSQSGMDTFHGILRSTLSLSLSHSLSCKVKSSGPAFSGREAHIIRYKFGHTSWQPSRNCRRYWRRKNIAYISNAWGASSFSRFKCCHQRKCRLCPSNFVDFQCYCKIHLSLSLY